MKNRALLLRTLPREKGQRIRTRCSSRPENMRLLGAIPAADAEGTVRRQREGRPAVIESFPRAGQ
jgi:hypothetical protein